jgi:hypothetical protein
MLQPTTDLRNPRPAQGIPVLREGSLVLNFK